MKMEYLKKFVHEPNYLQFRLEGAKRQEGKTWKQRGDEIAKQRFSDDRYSVVIGVVSEYGEVPIEISVVDREPKAVDASIWDQIVECSISVDQGYISLASWAGVEFGCVQVPNGWYRLRIYFGGLETQKGDGTADDHYRIQVWPAQEARASILK